MKGLALVKFNGTNYDEWFSSVKNLLRYKGFAETIDYEPPSKVYSAALGRTFATSIGSTVKETGGSPTTGDGGGGISNKVLDVSTRWTL